MSAHFQSSGPRSNAYSESKFTNWTAYDPFFAEARAAYKRFDERLPAEPKFPRVITLKPRIPDLIHACKKTDVIAKLQRMPPASLLGLRAVFLMAGTRKQHTCWQGKLCCYGSYWRSCVFLYAHPSRLRGYHQLDSLRQLRDFYLDDVLVHEVAHHIDRDRDANHKAKESFAYAYVQKYWND
jgi:hypothetical protein